MTLAARLVTIAALSLVATPALAHPPPFGVADFFGGLIHPAFVSAHLMAILGLGILIGQQTPRGSRAAAVVFIVALIAALAVLRFGVAPPFTLEAVLFSALMGGVLAALALPLPKALGWVLAAVTGTAIGLDSPPEVMSVREADQMLIGTAIGGTLLLVVIVEIAARLTTPWQRIGARVLGSWIAASAMLVLAILMVRNY